MIPSGHYILLNASDWGHFQVLRVDSRLTRRLYLATRCCPEHGSPTGAGSVVVDVKSMAERHPEYGPCGIIFEDFEALRKFMEPSEDDDPAGDAPSPTAAVH
jgi:hypothetical protein